MITADGSLRRGREVPMKAIVDEALRGVAVGRARRRLATARRRRADAGRSRRFWDDAVADSPGRSSRSRSTRSTRTCSPTPPGTTGPAEGRRCTSRAASSSRSRARSRTRRTRGRATSSTSSPTWAGSWARGRWSAATALGCTIVFAEGAPDWPEPTGSGGSSSSERVSILGLSPTLIARADPARRELVERHDLSSLRVLVTTGEPWNPEPYRWLVRARRRRRAARSSTARAGRRSARASSRPRPRRRSRPCSLGGPGARHGDGRRRRRGPLGARRGRRARLPQAVPRA